MSCKQHPFCWDALNISRQYTTRFIITIFVIVELNYQIVSNHDKS